MAAKRVSSADVAATCAAVTLPPRATASSFSPRAGGPDGSRCGTDSSAGSLGTSRGGSLSSVFTGPLRVGRCPHAGRGGADGLFRGPGARSSPEQRFERGQAAGVRQFHQGHFQVKTRLKRVAHFALRAQQNWKNREKSSSLKRPASSPSLARSLLGTWSKVTLAPQLLAIIRLRTSGQIRRKNAPTRTLPPRDGPPAPRPSCIARLDRFRHGAQELTGHHAQHLADVCLIKLSATGGDHLVEERKRVAQAALSGLGQTLKALSSAWIFSALQTSWRRE